MRKLFVAGLILFCGSTCNAFEWPKGVEILVPFTDVGAVYLYDFIGNESLVGAETDILRFTKAKDLTITAGAVTDVAHSGIPFVGAHVPIKLKFKPLDLGIFLSRNIEKGKNMAGIKASVKFW